METKTKEQVENLKAQLKQLNSFSSWHIIRSELQDIVNGIESKLFEIDHKRNEKVFTQHDINRMERKLLKLLINMPEELFEELKEFDKIVEEEV